MSNESAEKTRAKIAIVTGGGRGIGRATVLSLAARGVTSILTFKANEGAAKSVVALAEEVGARAVALPLDTGAPSTFAGFLSEVREALANLGTDRFDYLVNNAGMSSTASLADGTEAELDLQFAVHFKGVFLLTQALLPVMKDGGAIVNISSGLARFAMPKRSIYGPMKAAVEALTRYMALELGPRHISVNAVAPGAIATDFSGGIVRDNPQVAKMVADNTALGRAGRPEDVGPVIAGLLSSDFGWVTAQRIEVSGGMHI